MDDRYATDVLAAGWRDAGRRAVPRIEASADLVVEVAADGFCGAVVGVASGLVELEDRHGRRRLFPLGPGFLVDGADVVLTPPCRDRRPPRAPARTASGSFAAPETRARVARASRILVEGRHDAELVEKVWGDDLRAEGVVVEYLQGIDLLEAALDDEPPSAERRYGVLVDHLVAGSKESRIAEAIARGPHGAVRPDRRTPVRRRVAVRHASGAGHRAVAGRAAGHRHQGRHLPRRSAGRPRPPPTWPVPGSGSSARSRAIATSTRRCSAASRS